MGRAPADYGIGNTRTPGWYSSAPSEAGLKVEGGDVCPLDVSRNLMALVCYAWMTIDDVLTSRSALLQWPVHILQIMLSRTKHYLSL